MKKEYDFSKAERAKFHRTNARFNLPVHLKPRTGLNADTANRLRHRAYRGAWTV